MENKFKPLIDGGNEDLWKKMNQVHSIVLKESEEPGFLTTLDKEQVILEIDMNDLKPSFFTHELLHLYIKYKGVLVAKDLKERIDCSQTLHELFSDSLKEHLGNCLEHSKMLPLYLERGYKNEEFVRDYPIVILDNQELLELESAFYKGGMIDRDAVDTYIGKFFSMRTSNNPNFNYNNMYLGLQKINPSLYQVLLAFWEEWQTFSIGDPKANYTKMLDKFIRDLENWRADKVVI